jgi:hypothetical protein
MFDTIKVKKSEIEKNFEKFVTIFSPHQGCKKTLDPELDLDPAGEF